jgi:hypothetical protein
MPPASTIFLGVVQLAEHLCDTQKVRGSIPRAKTNADAARWTAHLPPKQAFESSILSIGTMLMWSRGRGSCLLSRHTQVRVLPSAPMPAWPSGEARRS